MSYHLENSSGDRCDHLYTVLRHWSQDSDHQIVFITQDSRQFVCSSKVMAVFSGLIRSMVSGRSEDNMAMYISVPGIEFDTLHSLVQLLVCGLTSSVAKDDLLEAAEQLDITIDNIEETPVDEEDMLEMNVYLAMEEDFNGESSIPDMMCNQAENLGFSESILEQGIKIENVECQVKSENTECEVNEGEKYQCQYCEKSYGRKDVLKNHVKRCHPEESDDKNFFHCPECDKVFHLKEHLNRHQIQHSVANGKPFQCSLCNSSFSRKDALQRHTKNIHSRDHSHNLSTE